MRVHALNELKLPSSGARLDLFLSLNSCGWVSGDLVVDQLPSAVFTREPSVRFAAGLLSTTYQIVGYAGVYHAVCCVGHPIHEVLALHSAKAQLSVTPARRECFVLAPFRLLRLG